MRRAILIGSAAALALITALSAATLLGYLPFLSNMLGLEQEAQEAGAEVKEKAEIVPIYLYLEPPFVINFSHQGTLRYLQVEIQLMATEQETLSRVQSRMPAIRNEIILYLSEQTYETLAPMVAKQKLRADIKELINKIIARKKMPGIEEVYFTAFVMQ